MNIYDAIVMTTFVMVAIMMISQYIDSRPTISKNVDWLVPHLGYEPVRHSILYTCLCV